jgi:hypothetical protein
MLQRVEEPIPPSIPFYHSLNELSLSNIGLPSCNGFTNAINVTYAFGHVATSRAYSNGGFTFHQLEFKVQVK